MEAEMTNRKDARGLMMSGCDTISAAHYETALWRFQCSAGDPLAAVDLALRERPDFVMAHVLKAYLNLCGTEKAGVAPARQYLAKAMTLTQNERESAHIGAATALADGTWDVARNRLQRILDEFPRDILALQVAHLFDFYCGDARYLRDRPARVLPEWRHDMPGYASVLAMHSFGLEETNDFSHAEDSGRAAIEIEPRDAWAHHAVAHVMEMQGRRTEGVDWMRDNQAAWSEDNFFAVHNWWHLALFHLGLDQIDETLALLDGPIAGGASALVLDMIDASALLWRLQLRGQGVGGRWQALAERWRPIADSGLYAFNDMHAMMAFVSCGQQEQADTVAQAQRRALQSQSDNADFTREVGLATTQAIRAFGEGRYADTVALLRPVRSQAHRFGGSHAQRDVLDQTLIEAARRAGQTTLWQALRNERASAAAGNAGSAS
jgi:hypothetical protein